MSLSLSLSLSLRAFIFKIWLSTSERVDMAIITSLPFGAMGTSPIWQRQARWLAQNPYADNTMRSPFVQEMILHLVIEKWRKAAEHRNVNVAPLTFYNVNAFEHSGVVPNIER